MPINPDVAARLQAIEESWSQLKASLAAGTSGAAIAAGPHPGAGAPASARVLVYVHGICQHVAGFSNPWWQSLHPYTNVFSAGNLGDTRREVVWSDVLRGKTSDRATITSEVGKAADDAMQRLELAAQIKGVITERIVAHAAAAGAGAASPAGAAAGAGTGAGGGPAADTGAAAGFDFRNLLTAPPFVQCIEDFSSYMLNDDIRRQILARFTTVVQPLLASGTPIDIISHSWGTVVAYEGLRELAGNYPTPLVQNWFTAGAALSILPVRMSLRPANRDGRRPAMVRQWINLDAAGDPVGGDLRGAYQIDQQFLNLTAPGCQWLDVPCRHSSYFVAQNAAVNRDIFARFINSSRLPATAAMGALPPAPPVPAALGALGAAQQSLADFMAAAPPITQAQRQAIVDEAIKLLAGLYVHLPLKRAMHAMDPVQALKLLRHDLPELSDLEFHERLLFTFNHLRDLHTNYVLPEPYQDSTAYLPFRIERFWDDPQQEAASYLVTRIEGPVPDPTFQTGVEVTHWNGVPIERAIEINGEREAGSNLEARRARGLETLTLRWMGMSLPPAEEWVVIGYKDSAGQAHEARFVWQVSGGAAVADLLGGAGATLGVAAQTEMERRVRRRLFSKESLQTQVKVHSALAPHAAASASAAPAAFGRLVEQAFHAADINPSAVSALPGVFKEFGAVQTPGGTFGYIRIAAFMVENNNSITDTIFINEFLRIAGLLPQNGLIIDVRGNGGGYIEWGERLLQLLTPVQIQPELFQLINTDAIGQLVQLTDLQPWAASVGLAVEIGETFSQALPLTPVEDCNDIGQRYQGPVVLIVDALCYSTTDIFIAGFDDHYIGTILGTNRCTGAGGANVWALDDLIDATTNFPGGPMFETLPAKASMRVALRRSTRVGDHAGTIVEELGVAIPPERFCKMTRKDILGDNADLKNRAGAELAKMPNQSLRGTVAKAADGMLSVSLNYTNIDRVDIYAVDRPLKAVDVTGVAMNVPLPTFPMSGVTYIQLEGFRAGTLVAAWRIPLGDSPGGGAGGGGAGAGPAPAADKNLTVAVPANYENVSEYTFGDANRQVIVRRASASAAATGLGAAPALGGAAVAGSDLTQLAQNYAKELEGYFDLTAAPEISGIQRRGDGTTYVTVTTRQIPEQWGATTDRTAFMQLPDQSVLQLKHVSRSDDAEAQATFDKMLQSAQPAPKDSSGEHRVPIAAATTTAAGAAALPGATRYAGIITFDLPPSYQDRTVHTFRRSDGSAQSTVSTRGAAASAGQGATGSPPAAPFVAEPGINLWQRRSDIQSQSQGQSPARSGAKAFACDVTVNGTVITIQHATSDQNPDPGFAQQVATSIRPDSANS